MNKRISDYVDTEKFLNLYGNTVSEYSFLNSLLEHDKDEQKPIIWENIELSDKVPHLILQDVGMMMDEIESTVNRYNKEFSNHLCDLTLKISLDIKRKTTEQE